MFNRRFDQPVALISFDVESPVDSNSDKIAEARVFGMKSRIGLKKSLIYPRSMRSRLLFSVLVILC